MNAVLRITLGLLALAASAGAAEPALSLAPERGALLWDGSSFVLVAEAYLQPRKAPGRIALVSIATKNEAGSTTRLRTIQGDALAGMLLVLTPTLQRAAPGTTEMEIGGRAIIWLPNLSFPEGEVPQAIEVSVGLVQAGEMISETATLALGTLDVSPSMRFPVRGEWIAINGPSGDSPHRRAVLLDPGGWLIGQRHALDLMKLVPSESGECEVSTGEGLQNSDYPCFGEPVLAPAAGRVVVVRDGLDDHPPMQSPPSSEPAGNQVVLAHGSSRYSIFAHLKKGSILVRDGQRVARGEELGQVGNSGHSTAPHLHYQLCDRPDVFRSQGLPASFGRVRIRRLGSRLLDGVTPIEGDLVEVPR